MNDSMICFCWHAAARSGKAQVGVARRLGKLEDADGPIRKIQRSYQEIQFDMGGRADACRRLELLMALRLSSPSAYRAHHAQATRILIHRDLPVINQGVLGAMMRAFSDAGGTLWALPMYIVRRGPEDACGSRIPTVCDAQ